MPKMAKARRVIARKLFSKIFLKHFLRRRRRRHWHCHCCRTIVCKKLARLRVIKIFLLMKATRLSILAQRWPIPNFFLFIISSFNLEPRYPRFSYKFFILAQSYKENFLCKCMLFWIAHLKILLPRAVNFVVNCLEQKSLTMFDHVWLWPNK